MDTTQKNRENGSSQAPRKKRPAQPGREPAVASGTQKKKSPAAAKHHPQQSAASRKKAAAASGQKRPAAEPERERKSAAAGKKPAYDAAETLTSGKRRAGSSSRQKQGFSLRLPWNSGDKKNLTREEQTRLRQEKRADAAAKKRLREEKRPSPVVVYTQPLPFNSSRLLVQLLTVTAVVVALVLGLSVFFKVEQVVVHGSNVYSAYTIQEASGITKGDNLLTFSRARANGQIQAKLPYVEKSRIGIKLPNTVNIYIEESAVTYAIQTEDGIWWLMNSDGKLVEQINSMESDKHTKVLGVTLTGPVLNEQAVATENVPTETDAFGEVIPVSVTGNQRLQAALEILRALEANDIVGDAASVDVTSLSAIELWYGTRYQVNLGDNNNMEHKIASMYDVILQLSNYQTGKLDCSFTTWQTEVGYTPFD
ncbi:MAG: FtsQ-type POTRA domain-containing protein [Oscillospiraceae bacterium]|nr:FtsQ-type POTRA domain-containing protein [Oscillospiraceae bacterium]